MQDTEKWAIDAIEDDRPRRIEVSIVVLVALVICRLAGSDNKCIAISEVNVLANWEACPSPN